MRLLTSAILVATAIGPSMARADDYIPPVVGGRTYVQHQVVRAKARHPQIAAIVVDGKREGGSEFVVLGSTVSATQVFGKVANPVTQTGGALSADGSRYVVRAPFESNSHHRIGTIAITFAHRKGAPTAPLDAIAAAVARDMARDTLSAKNAADPYPYDPAFRSDTYAQALTDRIVAKHPDLLVMMIHATPPGHAKNVIIGSNIGRIGKEADEDDLRVIEKGETNLEIGGDKDRFETELPLNDAGGRRIGALGLVFGYRDGADKEAIHTHGLAIRDEIARAIPSSAALFALHPRSLP